MEDDDDDEISIRDADDEDYDEYEDGDEVDEEEVDEDIGGEDEEEAEDEDGEREDTSARRRESEEYKSRRVAKLVAEVREFGEDIIDYNELAGIYDFPIDKFQVSFWSPDANVLALVQFVELSVCVGDLSWVRG